MQGIRRDPAAECIRGSARPKRPAARPKMRYLIVLLRDLGLDFAFGEAGRDFIAYFDSA
jgi:hypothetical protein